MEFEIRPDEKGSRSRMPSEMEVATPKFDAEYYKTVIERFGYDALEFAPVDFAIGSLDAELAQRRWLCHHDGHVFVAASAGGHPCIVTTGFGLSGTPHMGTLSQMLSAILLQRAGVSVQIVLGDLDAYNARGQSLAAVTEREAKYRQFLLKLGFDPVLGILRNQRESLNVLEMAYLAARYISDSDFLATEEDLSDYYIQHGAYLGITFPVKLAILLMIADFVALHKQHLAVLVMLGIDEHRYVRLARSVAAAMTHRTVSGLYSRLQRGLRGHPKMSKSLSGSAISVNMSADDIRNAVMSEPDDCRAPMDSPIVQMMCGTGNYDACEIDRIIQHRAFGGVEWLRDKRDYIERLVAMCALWPK
jgi:tryptophanyl-tRNA synthetase